MRNVNEIWRNMYALNLRKPAFDAFRILSDDLHRFHDIRREEKKNMRSTMNDFKSSNYTSRFCSKFLP
jgi:hypothetical protein